MSSSNIYLYIYKQYLNQYVCLHLYIYHINVYTNRDAARLRKLTSLARVTGDLDSLDVHTTTSTSGNGNNGNSASASASGGNNGIVRPSTVSGGSSSGRPASRADRLNAMASNNSSNNSGGINSSNGNGGYDNVMLPVSIKSLTIDTSARRPATATNSNTTSNNAHSTIGNSSNNHGNSSSNATAPLKLSPVVVVKGPKAAPITTTSNSSNSSNMNSGKHMEEDADEAARRRDENYFMPKVHHIYICVIYMYIYTYDINYIYMYVYVCIGEQAQAGRGVSAAGVRQQAAGPLGQDHRRTSSGIRK